MSVSFAGHQLHSPRFSLDEARVLARERFGVEGTASQLGSHQDQNALIDGPSGRFVLKIANAAFGEDELDLQNRAMLHLAERLPLEVPRPCPALNGSEIAAVERDGATYLLRLVTFVEGEPLIDALHLAPAVLNALGEVAGLVARGLEDFEHPAAGRALQWDPRHVGAVVEALAPHVEDPHRRSLAVEVAGAAAEAIERLAPRLRTQIAHCDVTDWNVIGRRDRAGRLMPCGVIDFGDVTRTLRVCELAVAASIAYGHDPDDPLCAAAEIVRGFDAACPLDDAELEALPHLVAARAAIVAVGTEQQAALEPHNAYAQRVRAGDWAICETAAAQPARLAGALFRLACGRSAAGHAPRVPAGAWPLPGIAPGAEVDLSPTGLDPLTPPGALGAHGEGRWHATRELSREEPETIHLGLDVFAPEGHEVRAPLAGRVERVGERELLLAAEGLDVRLAGLVPAAMGGEDVAAGAVVGHITAAGSLAPHLHVQAAAPGMPALPGLVKPALAEAWLALCPHPGPLLGLAAPARPERALLARRRAVIPHAQPLYYEAPPEIVRGAGQHLYDAQARAYLDCVNNVAVVGHSHPRVTAAATRQLRLLNTNSRFLYESMTAFAERLAGLLPDPLDRVFLVSTGSEANDLALRLARAATRRRNVLCIRDAYHGWTTATYEVSTSSVDNPLGALAPAEGVHPVLSPDTYRGPYGADDPRAGERYADAVRDAIHELAAADHPPAAFICEALYGNAGGIVLPDGYLQAAYAHVHAAGGVCIADEVQVGYGRLGAHFWGFEQQGVVPDIVTVAKATGNGHPIAAVITTGTIAEALEGQGGFFASVGGGPVSCEIGLAVLDILQEERLQENAQRVGGMLHAGLQEIVGRHEIAGAVHGMGLYLGLDLVRDRTTKQPAREETDAICERMRDRGAIVQPTGDGMNVLKLKPPLVFQQRDADWLLETLDGVLARGW
ncbi:MAG TPA: aminotransferase [Gaiellales bacterium]|jgi:4-aminobutyrate aminotransferase-like enzyme/Ser/Thr protein kinase RdoA (MazF antagonist)|nr:aminotransferase [Gaiellales bacterium]